MVDDLQFVFDPTRCFLHADAEHGLEVVDGDVALFSVAIAAGFNPDSQMYMANFLPWLNFDCDAFESHNLFHLHVTINNSNVYFVPATNSAVALFKSPPFATAAFDHRARRNMNSSKQRIQFAKKTNRVIK